MSLKTWKEEFAPVEPEDVPPDRTAERDLKKWIGLQEKNLAKHGLVPSRARDIKDPISRLVYRVNNETCACCFHYYDYNCQDCPLYKANGDFSCCESRSIKKISAYDHWLNQRNPQPMITLLKKAVKLQNDPAQTGFGHDVRPTCAGCGYIMEPNASCFKCPNCGELSGVA